MRTRISEISKELQQKTEKLEMLRNKCRQYQKVTSEFKIKYNETKENYEESKEKITELRDENSKLTAEIDELKSEVELLADNKLELKTDKKYTDDVRLCIMELSRLQVGANKISEIIQSVSRTLFHRDVEADQLPSRKTVERVIAEGHAISLY